MQKYANYEPSQADWLGFLPEHWDSRKVGALFVERKTKVSDKDFAPLSVTKFGVVPQLANAAKTNAGDNRKLVRTGDFVINSRSDRKGSCGVSGLDGSVSLINIVLTSRGILDEKYIHYLLRSQPFSEEYYHNGRGIVADLWTTRYSEMKSILLPVPPREEQDQIVRFLDWKVSSINKLINIKQEEIAELEAFKLHCITDKVTNGLSPEKEMKACASKWIKNVPSHWKTVSVRRAYTVILGKMLVSNMTDESDTLEEYICAKDVHFDGVNLSNLKKMWFSPLEREQYRIADGDLLVVEGGAVGNASIVRKTEAKDIYVQNSIHIIRAKDGIAINEYLYFWLFSLAKRGYMKSVCSVATIPHYTKDKVLSTIMPLPPLNEQKEIVEHLEKRCSQIDAAITSIESSIKELKELRARLIADAVTGKIDVRGIEIPEYEFVDEVVDADTEDDSEEETEEQEE